jgi:hypothetical protein
MELMQIDQEAFSLSSVGQLVIPVATILLSVSAYSLNKHSVQNVRAGFLLRWGVFQILFRQLAKLAYKFLGEPFFSYFE